VKRLKTFILDWLPPPIIRAVTRLKNRAIQFDGDFANWAEASSQCVGYNATTILSKVLDATLKVKRGEAAYERDSVVFAEIEYAWPITSGLMWAAAQNGGALNVLDFGGALGSSYFQNRAFLAALPSARWSVVEQPHYVAAGRKYIQDESLRFYLSIDECCKENEPMVILLSSVLQYLPELDEVVDAINRSTASVLIIDRTPFNNDDADKICIQNVPDHIYKASYPMRILSTSALLNKFHNWTVVAETRSPEGELVSNAGLKIAFGGMILRRRI
jgi:putative methyltransferase (TIGR04325 family)